MAVIGLLLAAGAGRRMGRPKGLLRHPDGTPWVARAVQELRAGGCHPVVVVVGASADQVAALLPAEVTLVRAQDWAQGMGASLRAGLAAVQDRAVGFEGAAGVAGSALAAQDADAVLVSLVDLPGVNRAVVARVVAAASPSGLARAEYAGVPGHPVLIGREHWAPVAAGAHGDAGAREYLAAHPVRLVECADVGHGTDLDTPDQLPAANPS